MAPINGPLSGAHRRKAPVVVLPAIPLPYIQRRHAPPSLHQRREINGVTGLSKILPPKFHPPSPPRTTSGSDQNDLSPSAFSPSSSIVTIDVKSPALENGVHTSATMPLVPDSSRAPSPLDSESSGHIPLGSHRQKSDESEVEAPEFNSLPAMLDLEKLVRDVNIPSAPIQESHPDVRHGTHHALHPDLPLRGYHASNGNLQFGGLSESDHSSPVPPHSGGTVPPLHGGDAMARSLDELHTFGLTENGFPPLMIPYGANGVPVPALDTFGRPIVSFGPVENCAAFHTAFDPSTPHSFHGSQSSVPTDEIGLYTPYPSVGRQPRPDHAQNCSSHVEGGLHSAGMLGPHAFPGMHPHPIPPSHLLPALLSPDADSLARYLQGQFSDASFLDCVLELRSSFDHFPPLRIPGHRLIFARSAVLRELLSHEPLHSSPTLRLCAEDKFIRPDAFYAAVQRLYGFPLLAMPQYPPSPLGHHTLADLPMNSTAVDRLDFALAYATSGHLLRWDSVLVHGLDMVARLLDWATIERALEFVLDGIPSSADGRSCLRFGEPTKLLINAIIAFVINHFPPNFSLDTSIKDPKTYCRVPSVVPLPCSSPSKSLAGAPATMAPVIARGTPLYLVPGGRRPRLSHIKFGDLCMATVNAGPDVANCRRTQSQRPASHVILSRILLNMPYVWLKPALESSGQGNLNGWASSEVRHQAIRDVVSEREARRQRALNAILTSRMPDSDTIKKTLQQSQPSCVKLWDVLGWVEEAGPYGSTGMPCLSRKWEPLAGGGSSGPVSPHIFP